MKFTKLFTLECCSMKKSSQFEDELASELLIHIKEAHPEFLVKLDKAGREAAKTQIGNGYQDEGKEEGDGWHTASDMFRDNWMENALKALFENPVGYKDIIENIGNE